MSKYDEQTKEDKYYDEAMAEFNDWIDERDVGHEPQPEEVKDE